MCVEKREIWVKTQFDIKEEMKIKLPRRIDQSGGGVIDKKIGKLVVCGWL